MKKFSSYIPIKVRSYILNKIPFANGLNKFFNKINSFLKWRELSKKNFIKLDLGSGPKNGTNGFTTVDIDGADICWNLGKGIPLKDESVDLIYSSHMLEHIAFRELIIFLKECKRVLKEEGVFSVCVPNARLFIDAYLKGEILEFHNKCEYSKVETGSNLDQLNYIAYLNGQHKYLFDKENLVNTFLTAGFTTVSLREFDPSLDEEARAAQSIFAVARKN